MLAGGFEIPRRAPLGEFTASETNESGNAASAARKPKSPLRIALIGFGLAVYTLIVVAYFFKGSAIPNRVFDYVKIRQR